MTWNPEKGTADIDMNAALSFKNTATKLDFWYRLVYSMAFRRKVRFRLILPYIGTVQIESLCLRLKNIPRKNYKE